VTLNSNGRHEPTGKLTGKAGSAASTLASIRAVAGHPAALVGVFLAVVAVTILHHEMWMDELNPWVLARDSQSLDGLIRNMHQEPHPAVWYLLLYGLSRFTRNPLAMQMLHLAIATGVATLLAFRSPFTRLETWLLVFGYFFVFEYAVISRGYALGALLILTACAFYARPRPRLILVALCLAGAANTSAYGFFISAALALGIAVDRIAAASQRESAATMAAAAAIFLAAAVIGAVTTAPPADLAFARSWYTDLDFSRAIATVNLVWAAYLPLPDPALSSPWNSSLIVRRVVQHGPLAGAAGALAAILMAVGIALALRRDRTAVTLYVASAVIVLSFIYVKYTAGLRHHGHLYLALIAAIWIARRRGNTPEHGVAPRPSRRFAPNPGVLLMLLLVGHAAAGLYFVMQDIRRPFSFSRDLAAFVQSLPRAAPVVVAQHHLMNYAGPVLSGYLRRPLYYVLASRSVRMGHEIWDQERARGASQEQLTFQLERFAADRGTDIYVVTNNWQPEGLGTQVAHFPEGGALQGDERSASVYLFRQPAPVSMATGP
jgi:hypothetical protein